jgi:predicted RNA-binding Zn-ribbon protein involved in translation (DUF1610 family)
MKDQQELAPIGSIGDWVEGDEIAHAIWNKTDTNVRLAFGYARSFCRKYLQIINPQLGALMTDHVADALYEIATQQLAQTLNVTAETARQIIAREGQANGQPTHAKKVDYRCPNCGSRDICSDAAARWNVQRQVWELCDIHDNMACQECGVDGNIGQEWEAEAEGLDADRVPG